MGRKKDESITPSGALVRNFLCVGSHCYLSIKKSKDLGKIDSVVGLRYYFPEQLLRTVTSSSMLNEIESGRTLTIGQVFLRVRRCSDLNRCLAQLTKDSPFTQRKELRNPFADVMPNLST